MEKKIKVLIVGSDLSVKGGITSVIDRFLNYKWDYIDIELLPTYIEGSKYKRSLFFFKSIVRYIKRLIKNDFDIAHIHMSYKGSFFRKYLIIKLSKMFKKKTILHLHGSEFEVFYNNSNNLLKKMLKNTLEEVDSVIVLGKSWREIVQRIAPKSKINIFNNAVNIPDFKAKWNNEKINILFLGVLIKRKGIYELIQAIKELDKSGIIKQKNIKFSIGGTGPEEYRIKNMVKEYNLEYCIEMLGWVSGEMKEMLFKQSQIFILPSYNEGLPMSILEAMSYGIPTISTHVGSISEVVINNKTGYLLDRPDSIIIKEAIQDIILDNTIWEEMSKLSKKLIVENFNEERYFDRINMLYLEV